MKKFLVIGNPIKHSLSPKLHNYWIKQNNINAFYDKKQLSENDIKDIIKEVVDEKVSGINVTVPFKKSVIPFLDKLTSVAKETQSVNTIYKRDDKIIGDNTDVGGFEHALQHINYNVRNKKVLILGALKNMGASEITLSNRTKEKAENLKKTYSGLNVINWGDIPNFDMIINATSLGLKEDDEIKINYSQIGPNKLFYDIIYNPKKTKFLSSAKQFSNKVENGKGMFVYQAQLAFEICHKIKPKIDTTVLKLLDND